jgi:DNA-binding NtrC family response regulator
MAPTNVVSIERQWLAAYTRSQHEHSVASQLQSKAVEFLLPQFKKTSRWSDIRLISATHRDLKELVRQRSFREDLYFRITIIPLRIPPLRERVQDIPLLAEDILARIAAERGCDTIQLDAAAATMLQQYPWPGNIREMRNVLERAAQIAQHSTLSPRDLELQYATPTLHDDSGNGRGELDTNLTLREVEARHIEAVLEAEDGSIDRAARRLGISRSSLYSKVKSKEVARSVPLTT